MAGSSSSSVFLDRPHAPFECPEHGKTNKITRGKTSHQPSDFCEKNLDLVMFLQESSAFKEIFTDDLHQHATRVEAGVYPENSVSFWSPSGVC